MPNPCLLKVSTINNEETLTITGIINDDAKLSWPSKPIITSVVLEGVRVLNLFKLKTFLKARPAKHKVNSLNCVSLTLHDVHETRGNKEIDARRTMLIQLVADFAEDNECLCALSLTHCDLTSDNLEPLLDKSDCWLRLTNIDFSNNQLNSHMADKLKRKLLLPNRTPLQTLLLANNHLCKDSVRTLHTAASNSKEVRHLNLISTKPNYHTTELPLSLCSAHPLISLGVRVGRHIEAVSLADVIRTTHTLQSLEVKIDKADYADPIIDAIGKNQTITTLDLTLTPSGYIVESDFAEAITKNTSLRRLILSYPLTDVAPDQPLAHAIAGSTTLLSFHLSAYCNQNLKDFFSHVLKTTSILDFEFTNLNQAGNSVYNPNTNSVAQKNKSNLLEKCRTELANATNPFDKFPVLDKYVTLINDMQEIESLDDIYYDLKCLVYPELCRHYLHTYNLGAYLEIAALPEADPEFKQLSALLKWALACINEPTTEELSNLAKYFGDDEILDRAALRKKILCLLDDPLAAMDQFKTDQLGLRTKAEEKEVAISNTIPPLLIAFLDKSEVKEERNPPELVTALQCMRRLLTMEHAPPLFSSLKKFAVEALAKHPVRPGLFEHYSLAHRFLSVIASGYDYAHLENHPLLVIPENAQRLSGIQPSIYS